MSEKSVTPNKTLVDELFRVPPGAEEQFVYVSREGQTVTSQQQTDASVAQGGEILPDGFVDYGNVQPVFNEAILDVPTNFKVISQTLRRAPGGQQVVDIVIELTDVPGASGYEIQVVKV